MPTKKVVKKNVKKVVAKRVGGVSHKSETHFLKRHISVASPLGMVLALAFLVAAAAVAQAGYKAITAQPVGVNEVRMDNMVKRVEITGVISREQATRGAVVRYVLTTSDNTKYELIGMNAGLLERMEKMPSERSEKKEEIVYSLEKPEEVARRMEQKKQANEETNPARRKTQERVEQAKTKPMTETELLSKNNKIMDAYIGKTVTVVGSRVGNMPKPTPKGNQKGKVQYRSELPQFVVKTITVVQ